MNSPIHRVGAFISAVEPLFTREKPISFDPVQTAFLQRLVRESTLQAGLTIAKEDFFKGIVYLDYFTEVIAGRSTLLEDMDVIVEELEKMHEYLDVDLELLVRYSGLFVIKDLKGGRHFRKSSRNQMARRAERCERRVSREAAGAGALDLFHQAVGRLFCDLICSEEVADRLGAFETSNDLRAAVFVDSLLQFLPADEVSDAARTALQGGELMEAGIELIAALVNASEGWSLKSHVEQIKARLEREES